MANINYTELKAQKYLTLENIKAEEVRNLFRLRVRMAPFGENFKDDREHVICPLCGNLWDSQAMSFQCEYITSRKNIMCDMADIYTDDINLETARTVREMLRFRKNEIKKQETEIAE